VEQWWCLDCLTRVELSPHGRCQICGSEAVDTMERPGMCPTSSSIHTPVNDVAAERVIVDLEPTLWWQSQEESPATEEPVLGR
jgi:hypothetical protein